MCASMGPRSGEHGERGVPGVATAKAELQWGRALVSTESERYELAIREPTARLQWGRALVSTESTPC